MNPWTDVAQMIARLLFQTYQIPLSLDDVRRALQQKVNLLKNTLELDGEAVQALSTLVGGCKDTAQLASKMQESGHEKLCSQLRPHLEQEEDGHEAVGTHGCSLPAKVLSW